MTPEQAYKICLNENKKIKEYEPIILKDFHSSYHYARYIIKGRWLEAEPIILTNKDYSYWYALDVIKGRWLEAEPTIRQHDYLWERYCIHFNINQKKINWKVGL